MTTIADWVRTWTLPTSLPPGRGVTAQPSQRARVRADGDPRRPKQPERRLMAAILRVALADLSDTRTLRDDPHRKARARAWIMGADAPMTFEFVCDALGLDVASARRAILDPDRQAAALFELGAAVSA